MFAVIPVSGAELIKDNCLFLSAGLPDGRQALSYRKYMASRYSLFDRELIMLSF